VEDDFPTKDAVSHARLSFPALGTGATQFGKERSGISRLPLTILFPASSNLFLKSGVAQIQVMLHLIGIHDARHRNSAFLQDEVLAIHVNTPDHLSQIDPRSGDRHSMNDAAHGSDLPP
jgi:hypothetical protein